MSRDQARPPGHGTTGLQDPELTTDVTDLTDEDGRGEREMACSPSGSTESWRDRIMGRWKMGEGREPAGPLGWRTSRSVASAASLLALSGHLPRPKAGASSTHFQALRDIRLQLCRG